MFASVALWRGAALFENLDAAVDGGDAGHALGDLDRGVSSFRPADAPLERDFAAHHLGSDRQVGQLVRLEKTLLDRPEQERVGHAEVHLGLDLGFPVYRRDNMLRSSSVEFFWYEEGRLRVGSQVMETLNPAAGGAG